MNVSLRLTHLKAKSIFCASYQLKNNLKFDSNIGLRHLLTNRGKITYLKHIQIQLRKQIKEMKCMKHSDILTSF